jgi:hypothetical protein
VSERTPHPVEIDCPTCGKPVRWEAASPYRPFCSRRCRLIDLGEWLDGGRRIADGGEEGGDAERDEWQE